MFSRMSVSLGVKSEFYERGVEPLVKYEAEASGTKINEKKARSYGN